MRLQQAPQYKELFRLEENVHSDWSNDYAATALKGWLSDRLSDVFAGVTGTQASMAAALNPKGGPKLRHDAKAFQRTGTGGSSLAQFKPLELDLTVVNHLRATLSIGLNNKRVGSMNGCLSKTLTVSDGDVWQLSAGSMKMQWVVTAEKGIYQEVHIGEPPAGQPDPCFPDIATYEELMGKPPLPSKGYSLFTEP